MLFSFTGQNKTSIFEQRSAPEEYSSVIGSNGHVWSAFFHLFDVLIFIIEYCLYKTTFRVYFKVTSKISS